jgi:hypothetical protein
MNTKHERKLERHGQHKSQVDQDFVGMNRGVPKLECWDTVDLCVDEEKRRGHSSAPPTNPSTGLWEMIGSMGAMKGSRWSCIEPISGAKPRRRASRTHVQAHTDGFINRKLC